LCPGRGRANWPIPALSTREIRLTLAFSGGGGIAWRRGCHTPLGCASPRSGRAGGVHGVRCRAEITRVEVGVGAEVDGRVVAERCRRRRYGHSLLGHQARCRTSQHIRRHVAGQT